MDTSSSELQELRRLVGELTARVFRLEQALNLRPGLPQVPAPTAPTPPPTAPPEPPYSDRCRHSSRQARVPSAKQAERTWNPASVRTG